MPYYCAAGDGGRGGAAQPVTWLPPGRGISLSAARSTFPPKAPRGDGVPVAGGRGRCCGSALLQRHLQVPCGNVFLSFIPENYLLLF